MEIISVVPGLGFQARRQNDRPEIARGDSLRRGKREQSLREAARLGVQLDVSVVKIPRPFLRDRSPGERFRDQPRIIIQGVK